MLGIDSVTVVLRSQTIKEVRSGGWEWLSYKSDNTVYAANPQMTLDRDGILAVSGGLKLPTTGGTAATLSHYEEYDFQPLHWYDWRYPCFRSSLVRLGKLVTMSFKTDIQFTVGRFTDSFY